MLLSFIREHIQNSVGTLESCHAIRVNPELVRNSNRDMRLIKDDISVISIRVFEKELAIDAFTATEIVLRLYSALLLFNSIKVES